MRFWLCFTAKFLETVPKFETRSVSSMEVGENFPRSIGWNDGIQTPGMTHPVFLSSV